MKNFMITLLLFVSVQVNAYMCGNDVVLGYTLDWEKRACETHGYCLAYDYNPETAQYEEFYGFHHNCAGTEQRRLDKYICQVENGYVYESVTEGFWEMCIVNP